MPAAAVQAEEPEDLPRGVGRIGADGALAHVQCLGALAAAAPAHAFDKLVTKWWLWLPVERIRIIAGALHDAQF